MSGVSSTAIAVSAPTATSVTVMTTFWDSSSSRSTNVVNSGTSVAESMPPMSSS